MKKSKILTTLLAMVMSVSALTACGGGSKTDPDAIQISVAKLGYGTQWLHNIANAYTNKTGVKIQIREEVGQDGNTKITTEIESLVSDVDIVFQTASLSKNIYKGSISTGGQQYDCLYADITDVYKATLDGENGATIESKMNADVRSLADYDGKYYSLPWQGGVIGIVRNNDVWTRLGFTDADTPLTTDQFFSLCDKIVQKSVFPFIYCSQDEYYTMFSPIWFAQYEGEENMNLFRNGRDPDGNVSEYLYTYDGQGAALRAMKQLIAGEGYQDSSSLSLDFTDMQGYFLNGRSVFCVNGSWLEIEMGNYEGANIEYIRTPVISEIVNKATSIKTAATANGKTDDEMLALVIGEIDEGKTSSSYSQITQDDFDIVKEAREISYLSAGDSAVAYIPSYSDKIDAAKEFLKFMYSDTGMNIYYETLNGAALPLTPTSGYKSNITLTTFRKAVNKAEEDGYVFRYSTSKHRMFSIAGVDAYYRNGTGGIVAEFKKGTSVEQMLTWNTENIKGRWAEIRKYL